jgi:hypothetical protein
VASEERRQISMKREERGRSESALLHVASCTTQIVKLLLYEALSN